MKFGKMLIGLLLSAFTASAALASAVVSEQEHAVRVSKEVFEKVTCSTAGPKVMVGSVACKAAECQGGGPQAGGLMKLLQLAGVPTFEGLGEGLRDMFTTALSQSGCFKVVDPKALKELEEVGIEVSKAKPEYLITGAITSISWKQKSGSFGGGYLPIVGAITKTKTEARMTMDVRVVRTEDGEVVFSKSYSAESGKTRYGIIGAGLFGFGGAASGLAGTAMEEVARDIIARASADIAKLLNPESVRIEIKPAEEQLKEPPEEDQAEERQAEETAY